MNKLRAFAVLSIVMLAGGIVYDIAFYDLTVYPGFIANDWLYRARATNDLVDMATNLGRADTILQSFHGSPAWPFPTPETNFDQIRDNIEVDIGTCHSLSVNSTLSSFAYQQAVANLQETINEITVHLNDALNAIWANPALNPFGWLLAFTEGACIAGVLMSIDW